MSIIETLMSVPDAVDGGRVAIERLDYQTAWGLSRAIVLHTDGKAYAVGFEFHDDIVELDDADNPTKASFYQIKTDKTKNWSLNRIAARKKEKGVLQPSFAWRMFDNANRFGGAVHRLVFVSNMPCPSLGSDYKDFAFSSAPELDVEKFIKAMQTEDGSFKREHVALFHFSYSPFNLGSFDKALLGEVADFIQSETGLEHVNPKAFALMLVDQCNKRSKKLSDLSSFDALKSSKFVTRADMDKWLGELKAKNENRVHWTEVAAWFSNIHEAQAIKAHFIQYENERRSRLGVASLKFQAEVKKLVAPHMETGQTLTEMLNAALPEVRNISHQWSVEASVNDDYLRAIMLYEYCHVG
ncbi:dsDNA nuclease domain-containing protein [Phyllobacterium sophorae]|uniref:CD-NTase associated protein 4-like DNA endonuclease domain-containing protein n=1 Tax=Phyllobacterium sophorae TaxID=1520277 RepID=A0A2P7BFF7_9HYPH|nr:dsDNA nuclease domain-containing protein [Phyllobacterium sophorae]PSH65159.1 hypothetical protein CU103_09050 [Phyllobacterium sophorae]